MSTCLDKSSSETAALHQECLQQTDTDVWMERHPAGKTPKISLLGSRPKVCAIVNREVMRLIRLLGIRPWTPFCFEYKWQHIDITGLGRWQRGLGRLTALCAVVRDVWSFWVFVYRVRALSQKQNGTSSHDLCILLIPQALIWPNME